MVNNLEKYIKEINECQMNFVRCRVLETLVRLEQKEEIDEMAYLKALELLATKN